jgi:hypothetical protein
VCRLWPDEKGSNIEKLNFKPMAVNILSDVTSVIKMLGKEWEGTEEVDILEAIKKHLTATQKVYLISTSDGFYNARISENICRNPDEIREELERYAKEDRFNLFEIKNVICDFENNMVTFKELCKQDEVEEEFTYYLIPFNLRKNEAV